MGNEKMDSTCMPIPIGGWSSCTQTERSMPSHVSPDKTRNDAIYHMNGVLDEMWEMYKNEHDRMSRIQILGAIAENAVALHKMGQ